MDIGIVKASALYYVRLVIYVAILITLLELMQRIPQLIVAALKSIILFVILLSILITLKVKYVSWFEQIQWFCAPGVLFLKSWTSLFFFVYLVQLPIELADVAPVQILSWVFQVCLGNVIALGVCAFFIDRFLVCYDYILHSKETPGDNPPAEDMRVDENPAAVPHHDRHDHHHHHHHDMATEITSRDEFDEWAVHNTDERYEPIHIADQDQEQQPEAEGDIESMPRGLTFVEIMDVEPSDPTLPVNTNLSSLPPAEEAISITPLPPLPAVTHEPYVPSFDEIFQGWGYIFIFTAIVNFFYLEKPPGAIICFQLSASILVYMLSTTYRMRLLHPCHWIIQSICQSPFIYSVVIIWLVIFSSKYGLTDWQAGLSAYLTSTNTILSVDTFGPGNYLTIFLNPAIVSLAFAAMDPLIVNHQVILSMIPLFFVICAIIYIFAALLSNICQSPAIIAYPLLAHSITTPIALAVSSITGGNMGLTAATAVLNGVMGLRMDSYLLDWWGIKNPINRGISNGTAGTLLGIIALMEKPGEEEAIGIGMAGYSMTTVIFAILMAISPFKDLIVNLT